MKSSLPTSKRAHLEVPTSMESSNPRKATAPIHPNVVDSEIALSKKQILSLTSESAEDDTLSDHIPDPPAFRHSSNLRPDSQPGAFPVQGVLADTTAPPQEQDEQQERIQEAAIDAPISTELTNATSEVAESIDACVVEDDLEEDYDPESGDLKHLEEVMDVRPLPPETKANKGPIVLVGIICLLGVAVISVILALSIRPNDSIEDQIEVSTGATHAAKQHYPPFSNDLHPKTLEAIQDDTASPQYRANEWMWKDPAAIDSYSAWQQHQRFAMAVIYYSMNGDQWFRNDNWLSYTVPECNWFSQSNQPCNEAGELVIEDLHSNNLSGTLPMEIQLASVKDVDYSHNNIGGGLPQLISTNRFESFVLSNNRLEPGRVISDGGYDGSMRRVIRLDSNRLFFPSMQFVTAFPNLEVLNMTGNWIGGTLPAEELHITNRLTYLGLGSSNISGTVPAQLGLLSGLTGLDISDNSGVHGSIPTELAALESLAHLDVSGTSLSGEIPSDLCTKAKDEVLDIMADCGELQCCLQT